MTQMGQIFICEICGICGLFSRGECLWMAWLAARLTPRMGPEQGRDPAPVNNCYPNHTEGRGKKRGEEGGKNNV
jgi:hypothetical protein